MQFSTDLALMNTQPQCIKADDATRTNDNKGIAWCTDSCKGKLLNLVSLTNIFETLYPRLLTGVNQNQADVVSNLIKRNQNYIYVLSPFNLQKVN